ncbi:Spo0E family sporulation regulatory protein-aspartic acid phosphatase [Paenibacillus sp. Dod16]|uniref:Spo0E family sporulation regulatory protein-aspartic acid phosphatase n=1 Tax=Paenibacillus sp. Dod16 TaxID=3416392 RepID=UPI003CEBDD40
MENLNAPEDIHNLNAPEDIHNQIQALLVDLEELRSQMEKLGSELGMLSEEVLEVSQRLDVKINEYILLTKQLKDIKNRLPK